MSKRLPPLMVIAAGIAVACLTASWPELHFLKLSGGEFMSHLATLFVFALLIERTVEVFLTIWRAEESNRRQAEVKRLIDAGKPPEDAELKHAQEALLEFKAATIRWAFPSSFILGLLVASFGVRVMSQFTSVAENASVSADQMWWFHLIDIVLTAALLAGGADPIHKFMDAFRKFMEATSSKAAGTTSK